MKVLIIGSGGREHALVWKIKDSPCVDKIYALPGNGGISKLAEIVKIDICDIEKMADFAENEKIDLTVVGPEGPLVAGIVDVFQKRGLKIFGPTQEAARLEGSKVFAKRFMKEFGIPTAGFEVFCDYAQANEFIKNSNFPLVIKADGLCAGKGVFIVKDLSQAEEALSKIMRDKIFAQAGSAVLIEEFLSGEEASILAVSDGKNLIALASSQDHKRAYDNDEGPNTGGMGAYSPAPVAEGDVMEKTIANILLPTIKGMHTRGAPFKGVLYAGIMIVENKPYVLEYNVRFGDPETQVILPRMKSDLIELLFSAINGELDKYRIEWLKDSCVTVVLASGGYPGSYAKEKQILGLNSLDNLDDIIVFHAGTKRISKDNKDIFLTFGGRVLNVTARASNLKEAKRKAYRAIDSINFENMHYRKDISDKALSIA